MNNFTRQQIVEAAREYISVRFKKGGRDKGGMDCVGVLVCVGRDLGEDIEDLDHYTFDFKPDLFRQHIRKQSLPGSKGALKPGQIVLLKDRFFPFHCGIIGKLNNKLTIINANMKKRAVVEQPMTDWLHGLSETRDYKGVIV